MKNYYDILGIKEDCSQEEIKKAYRKLSLKFHPDKNEGDEFFSDMFKSINNAYEILKDPISRKKYDNSIKDSTNSYSNNNSNQSKNENNKSQTNHNYSKTENNYTNPTSSQKGSIRLHVDIYRSKIEIEKTKYKEYQNALKINRPNYLNLKVILGSIFIILFSIVIVYKIKIKNHDKNLKNNELQTKDSLIKPKKIRTNYYIRNRSNNTKIKIEEDTMVQEITPIQQINSIEPIEESNLKTELNSNSLDTINYSEPKKKGFLRRIFEKK